MNGFDYDWWKNHPLAQDGILPYFFHGLGANEIRQQEVSQEVTSICLRQMEAYERKAYVWSMLEGRAEFDSMLPQYKNRCGDVNLDVSRN